MTLDEIAAFATLGGDNRLLLPLSTVFVTALRFHLSPALSGRWLRGLLTCLGVIALVKILGYSLFPLEPQAAFVSASGHVGFAVYFFGTLALIVAPHLSGPWRRSGYGMAATLMAAIAASRVVLGKHTIAEISVGGAIGIGCVMLFHRDGRNDPARRDLLAILVLLLVARFVLVWLDVRPEDMFAQIGFHLATVTGI